MAWIVLDLERTLPATRCCYICNPELAAPFAAADQHYPRLSAFAADFLFPIATPHSRPASVASTSASMRSHSARVKVQPAEKERLRQKLTAWRDKKHQERGSPGYLSASIIFPPKQLESFISNSEKIINVQTLTARFLRKSVTRDARQLNATLKPFCRSSTTGVRQRRSSLQSLQLASGDPAREQSLPLR